MSTLQSKGKVRRFVKDGDLTFVGFYEHDGYFQIQDNKQHGALLKAHKNTEEVTFVHDGDLKIISISE